MMKTTIAARLLIVLTPAPRLLQFGDFTVNGDPDKGQQAVTSA